MERGYTQGCATKYRGRRTPKCEKHAELQTGTTHLSMREVISQTTEEQSTPPPFPHLSKKTMSKEHDQDSPLPFGQHPLDDFIFANDEGNLLNTHTPSNPLMDESMLVDNVHLPEHTESAQGQLVAEAQREVRDPCHVTGTIPNYNVVV